MAHLFPMYVAFICRVWCVRGAQGARGGWGKANTGNGSETFLSSRQKGVRILRWGDYKIVRILFFI